MKKIKTITSKIFREIESHLIKIKQDSDKLTFAEIKELLNNPSELTPEQFAEEIIYVILAGGFKQKTAKKYFYLIMEYLQNPKNSKLICHPEFDPGQTAFTDLLQIFNNSKKIKAIMEVWKNKEKYCEKFYSLKDMQEQLSCLKNLPHIGEITKYHIARNLGLDFVKYDVWIQRLGVCLYGSKNDIAKINNAKLHRDVKNICDKMFLDFSLELQEKRGYIDVVLWKACQQGVLKISELDLFILL